MSTVIPKPKMIKRILTIEITNNIPNAEIKISFLFFIKNRNLSLIDVVFLLLDKPIIIILNPISMLIHRNESLNTESEIVFSTKKE